MVSRWLNPPPKPKRQDDPAPPYNPNAPSFAYMKQQIGKKPPTMRREVFRINKSMG